MQQGTIVTTCVMLYLPTHMHARPLTIIKVYFIPLRPSISPRLNCCRIFLIKYSRFQLFLTDPPHDNLTLPTYSRLRAFCLLVCLSQLVRVVCICYLQCSLSPSNAEVVTKSLAFEVSSTMWQIHAIISVISIWKVFLRLSSYYNCTNMSIKLYTTRQWRSKGKGSFTSFVLNLPLFLPIFFDKWMVFTHC